MYWKSGQFWKGRKYWVILEGKYWAIMKVIYWAMLECTKWSIGSFGGHKRTTFESRRWAIWKTSTSRIGRPLFGNFSVRH